MIICMKYKVPNFVEWCRIPLLFRFGNHSMKKTPATLLISLGLFCWVMLGSNSFAAAEKIGKITGGVMHTAPAWFKESFLEIREDVDEATAENKHVILFFQLNACPYCDRMLSESFEAEPLTSYIQDHFDTIAINIRGDRDIVFNEETSLTEKELSEMLKVRGTPAILFLDSDNKTVVRVNGYRAPERFKKILQYVNEKGYQQGSLAEYLEKNLADDVYKLRDNKLFTQLADLSTINGPLALIFEDSSCYDCAEFHENLLSRDDVQKELKPFTVVRLDADSEKTIIAVDGNKTTPKALAHQYNMIFRPGVLMFDEGKLIRRYDSLLYSHHFKEGFRFVGGGYYKKEDYRSYSRKRTEELLSEGIDIDLGQ